MSVWLELNNALKAAIKRGALDEADALLPQLQAEARRRGEPELACNTSFTEGLLRDAQGRHQEAEDAFTTALRIDEKLRGPDHATVAETLNSIGIVRSKRGDLEGALDAYRRAAGIVRVKQPFRAAEALCSVGARLLKLERFEEALATYEDALASARAEPKTPHAELANALLGAGETLRQSRRYPEAFSRLAMATQTARRDMWPRLADVVTRAWYTLGVVSRHGLQGCATQAAFAFWYATQSGAAGDVARAATAQLATMPERVACEGDPSRFRLLYRDAADNLHVASFACGLHHLRQPLDADVSPGALVDVTLEEGRAVEVKRVVG